MNWQTRNVLVTGGGGFIGSHLTKRLLELGSSVVVLDDFSSGMRENLPVANTDLEIVEGNVANSSDVRSAIKGCDIVIHEAFPYAQSGMGLDQQFTQDGAVGIFNVLKASVKEDIEKVVYASSVAVYGLQEYLPVDEQHPTKPFLPYGSTKLVGEEYCRNFSSVYGLDTVSLRYFYAYGPEYASFSHSALMKFIDRAVRDEPLPIYDDGTQIRDYTYIDDVVAGTLAAASSSNTNGDAYNISSGTEVTINELAETVYEIVDTDSEIRPAERGEYEFSDEYCQIPVGATTKVDSEWTDERDYVADISKARRELGYEPETDLRDGIEATAAWMDRQRNEDNL